MQTRKSRREKIEEKRKNRKPIMGGSRKLVFDELPKGFVGRWFNDEGSRIQDALNAGWEFLSLSDNEVVSEVDDLGTVHKRRVDKKASGEPLYAYLMVIEKEIFDEDQAAKQTAIDKAVQGMKKGDSESFGGRIDGNTTYVKTAQFD